MADQKISQLNALAEGSVSAANDVLAIVDNDAAETKKITVSALVNAGASAGLSSVDINGGSIDGTAIGANSASTGAFTTATMTTANVGALNATGNVSFNGGSFVFNESGANADFRIEGDTQPNLFVSDASADSIGIGTATPTSLLHLNDSTLADLKLTAAALGDAQVIGTVTSGSSFTLASQVGDSYLLTTTNTDLWFGTNNSEKFRVTAAGNVGIGTSSTTRRLEVLGASGADCNVEFRTTKTNGQAQLLFTNDARTWITKISSADNYEIVDSTAAATRMLIDSSGNVGIGTASPTTVATRNLHVFAGAGASSVVRVTGNNGTGVDFLQAADGDAYLFQRDNKNLIFGTNNTERMRITSAGSVGIGVTPSAWFSASRALQIGDTGVLEGRSGGQLVQLISNAFINSGGNYAYISSSEATRYSQSAGEHSWRTAASGTAGNTITFTQAMTLNASGDLLLGRTATSNYRLQITDATDIVDIAGTSASMQIHNKTSDVMMFGVASGDAIAFATNGNTTERMRISSAGDVGIGTTSNTAKVPLEVVADVADVRSIVMRNLNASGSARLVASGSSVSCVLTADQANLIGTIGTTNTHPLSFITSFAERMRITSAGDVGIGTTSPTSLLHLNDSTLADLKLTAAALGDVTITGTVTSGSSFTLASQVGDSYLFVTTNTPLRFGTNNAERMRITSGGNMVVGSTTSAGRFLSSSGDNDKILTGFSTASSGYTDAIIVSEFRSYSPNNTSARFLYCGDNVAERATIRSNGGLANYSANNVNLASDERLKKDISPLDSTWGKVKEMEVVNFRYKDCNEGDPLLYGVIAQQVQPIVPELVVVTQQAKEAVAAKDAVLDEEGNVIEPAVEAKEATPEYYGIREQPMYWLAIKALQEAMTRIEELEAKVAALEAK